jgi:hypothetical protein
MSVTYGGDKITFDDGSSIASGYTNFRNRIINGAMEIDQRNAGASVTLDGSGVYPVDRWRCDEASDGAATGQQVSDAPAGFVDSLRITTTSADASLTTNQYLGINQFIEGFNTADFNWGSANAKTITLSFWVKSSLTGTFAGCIDNNAGDRSYVFNYTISAANTWEYKTITIAGDTSGTWDTGNARGLGLRFGLGTGPSYEGTVGVWQTGFKLSSSGAVSIIGTLNATWQITGVQLEVGSFASTFERRPHGLELQLCQRYYYRLVSSFSEPVCTAAAYNSTISFGVVTFPVTMRTAPDIDQTSTSGQFAVTGNATSVTFTSFAYNERGADSITLYNNQSASVTQGYAYWFRTNASISGQKLAFTAEL